MAACFEFLIIMGGHLREMAHSQHVIQGNLIEVAIKQVHYTMGCVRMFPNTLEVVSKRRVFSNGYTV